MMLPVDTKLAFDAIRSAKWRSFLTTLGVVIGVASVVTVVGIGVGVKHQVAGQVKELGTDVITVRPGQTVSRSDDGAISDVNVLRTLAPASTFSDADYQVVANTPGLSSVVPMALVGAVASVDGKEYPEGTIIGTNEGFPDMIKRKIAYGGFFGADDMGRNIAVVGHDVAEQLFQQNAPVGRAVDINGQVFVISGVFEAFPLNPLTPSTDYNAAIYIPYSAAKKINNGQAQIQQIYVRPADANAVTHTVTNITDRLRQAHGGHADFSVLTQADNLAVSDKILDLLTLLISSVAAISLIVGGVGIMNIMLVSVSERTHEIGVRKAIGATSGQIMRQFMIEAASISLVGGMLGIILSLIANYFLRLFTSLQPVLSVPLALVALLIALAVGIFFGVTPAVKAARKDPIEALRRV